MSSIPHHMLHTRHSMVGHGIPRCHPVVVSNLVSTRVGGVDLNGKGMNRMGTGAVAKARGWGPHVHATQSSVDPVCEDETRARCESSQWWGTDDRAGTWRPVAKNGEG
jgi:hypothetical protein